MRVESKPDRVVYRWREPGTGVREFPFLLEERDGEVRASLAFAPGSPDHGRMVAILEAELLLLARLLSEPILVDEHALAVVRR